MKFSIKMTNTANRPTCDVRCKIREKRPVMEINGKSIIIPYVCFIQRSLDPYINTEEIRRRVEKTHTLCTYSYSPQVSTVVPSTCLLNIPNITMVVARASSSGENVWARDAVRCDGDVACAYAIGRRLGGRLMPIDTFIIVIPSQRAGCGERFPGNLSIIAK